jgi:hypothetical protein
MRKTLKLASAAAILATPAMATNNLENPLYVPRAGEVATRLGAGLMYKQADRSDAMKAKGQAGDEEFPIWRGTLNLGVGLTDWLSVRGQFAYTQNDDINRKGFNDARLGLNFRASDFLSTGGLVWDLYADAHLGGVSKMKAEIIPTVYTTPAAIQNYPFTFNYENYSNGRWGMWLGTRVGQTFDNLTVAAFAEVLHTFGNNNNNIDVSSGARTRVGGMVFSQTSDLTVANAFAGGMPASFTVDTKSTWEYNAGISALYQLDSRWSFGGGFTYKNRAQNTVEAVNMELSAASIAIIDAELATPGAANGIAQGLKNELGGPLNDGIQEYILTAVVAKQLTDSVQVALYGEYTFDNADNKSQNGTDIKAELGARVNVRF